MINLTHLGEMFLSAITPEKGKGRVIKKSPKKSTKKSINKKLKKTLKVFNIIEGSLQKILFSKGI